MALRDVESRPSLTARHSDEAMFFEPFDGRTLIPENVLRPSKGRHIGVRPSKGSPSRRQGRVTHQGLLGPHPESSTGVRCKSLNRRLAEPRSRGLTVSNPSHRGPRKGLESLCLAWGRGAFAGILRSSDERTIYR